MKEGNREQGVLQPYSSVTPIISQETNTGMVYLTRSGYAKLLILKFRIPSETVGAHHTQPIRADLRVRHLACCILAVNALS
jgi:hypothetical protein